MNTFLLGKTPDLLYDNNQMPIMSWWCLWSWGLCRIWTMAFEVKGFILLPVCCVWGTGLWLPIHFIKGNRLKFSQTSSCWRNEKATGSGQISFFFSLCVNLKRNPAILPPDEWDFQSVLSYHCWMIACLCLLDMKNSSCCRGGSRV